MERDVQEVRQGEREVRVLGDLVQRRVDGQEFTCYAARVEHQEERVTAPGEQVRHDVQDVERIVEVSGDLGQRPTAGDQEDAETVTGAGERQSDTPDDQDTRDDLLERDDRVRRHQTDDAVHHLDQLQGLEDRQR